MVAKAFKSARHPVLAHIVPTRRCNLACAYCNEFDRISQPVSTEEVLRRIDLLAGLGTSCISISGGEPMLHPELDEIIRRIRKRGMVASLLTNGYSLTPERINRLNRAGLDHLQISIDNVRPDNVSKKSLKVLEKKLQWLSQYAEFEVNINSVVGNCLSRPEEALVIARRARELGLTSTVGVVHDHAGQLQPLGEEQRRVYEALQELNKPVFSYAGHDIFQWNITRGLPNDWHCRAGCRYLYVCEDGLVHYCSQQRGTPGIPLELYTRDHLEREYDTVKPCAPYCTVSCVHRVALLDQIRENPAGTLAQMFRPPDQPRADPTFPFPVKVMMWMFLPRRASTQKPLLSRLAERVLGVH
jgi:MoaA/NifB/PqqE/SkfB family radical SAM enzyme